MGDQADKIKRRAALRKKIGCMDLKTLHDLVPTEAQPIVEEVKKTFEEVPAGAARPTEEDKQALLETAKRLNEEFRKKNELKNNEAKAEVAAVKDEAEKLPCPTNTKLTKEEIDEFNTKMLGPEGVDELSAILMERILEEQERLKAQVAKRDAGAAGNGAAEGGSRKRKRSKKRKGKGNKTRKNTQNNNNNNTTRRRKKTARRRRTKRA